MIIEPQRKLWQEFFDKRLITYDLSTIAVPKRRPQTNTLVYVPANVSQDSLCELFKNEISSFNLAPFFAPLSVGAVGSSHWDVYQFSDLVPYHDRSPYSDGPYAHWIRLHVTEEDGELVHAGYFDISMTIIEAMWLHLFLMHYYGQQYVSLQSGWQYCNGSKRKRNDRSPAIEWDHQDIKVCLRNA